MTVPLKYRDTYIPVKHFLTSYRALSDGKTGIEYLEKHLQSPSFFLSEWKVIWIGVCALLRSSIDLFKVDAKSCINQKIRNELQHEWKLIKENKEDHPIFWKFLRKERDNIIHEYAWPAYEAWIDKDGTILPTRLSLFDLKPDDADKILIMRKGHYKDQNSLDLLKESATWAESRIFDAIHRAGFDPDQKRNMVSFKLPPQSLLFTEEYGFLSKE